MRDPNEILTECLMKHDYRDAMVAKIVIAALNAISIAQQEAYKEGKNETDNTLRRNA